MAVSYEEPGKLSAVGKGAIRQRSVSLKRRNRCLVLASAALLVVLHGSQALAQNGNGQWRLPNKSAGGGTRQATLKPRVDHDADREVVIVPSQAGSLLNPVYRVPIIVVPAVLLTDGSVFANFGFGFEPVFNSCRAVAQVGAVVGANGVVLSPAPAATHTQTSSQMTRAHLLQTGLPVHSVVVSDLGRLACFNRDGSGLVSVFR
jgi:hypothetical protein